MRQRLKERTLGYMRRRSYAVWWKEEDGPRHVGKLEVALFHALLSGKG